MFAHTLGFQIRDQGIQGYSVSLTVAEESETAPFVFDLRSDSRISRVISDLANGIVTYDNLRDIGSQLYLSLIPGRVGELFARARDEAQQRAAAQAESCQIALRLSVPKTMQHLPWECLYDEARTGFLVTNPAYSIVREAPVVTSQLPVAPARAPVMMLVVIPEGSGLSVERELHGLRVAIARLGESIALHRLDGPVTPDLLRARIDARAWDIVHFIGHGDIVDGSARVRLNSENPESDGTWLTGETFATFFARRVPRLVVLNSCLGGSQSPQRTLSGIPPFLLRAGIPAVVAMQYEIPDDVAIRFAASFYGELLGGTSGGYVGAALAEARRTLFQNAGQVVHSFIMPVLYETRDHRPLFEVAVSTAPPPPPPPARSARPDRSLPSELVAALKERRCIPVIGSDGLRTGAVRSSTIPPGPHELAYRLASEVRYPRMNDFELSDTAGEAAGVWLLPSVCQHYERYTARYRLLMAVQKTYEHLPATAAADSISAWDVPGIICTYFDGLIEQALTRRRRTFRSVTSVDQKLSGYAGEMLLVHLRGIFDQAETLVLTERDHEQLWDRMARISSDITDLTRKRIGLSLVYIGVSPRDPLVRRLTQKLRGGDGIQVPMATQGPMYFACPDHTTVDDAYWDSYGVEWLPLSCEDAVFAISQTVSEGTGR